MINKNQYLNTHQILFLCTSATLFYFYWPVGGHFDQVLSQIWLTDNGRFYLRDHWALSQLSHHYVKNILIAIYLYFGLTALHLTPKAWKNLSSWQYGYFFSLVCLSTLLIALLKKITSHDCPWDIVQPTVQGYNWVFQMHHGHCFPGGHASSGFALMAGYFIFKTSNLKLARFFLMSSLILGFAMGWAQMMRGAHFMSHHFWTAWWIWSLNVFSYAFIYPILEKKCGAEN